MSDSSAARVCSHCGSPLPPGVPESQCPRCLMAQIVEPTRPGDAASAAPPLSPEELAPHFPQLEILACLGRGGMGVVYKARQKSLNRLVALKLLAPERVTDPRFAERFAHEAQALAALNHPNIVTVHEFGRADGLYFLIMEFVDGVNLRQLLQAKRLTPKEALSIVPPVCDALQCAHEHGIAHRDIKPENLLIDKNGTVKIADFGIAKMLGSAEGATTAGTSAATTALGTPDYAAPEQVNGTADHRADIYSLGVVLYEMLTGERPKENIAPPSKRVQVDIRIDEIVLRALEKEPELRFATAAEFRTQVEAATAPTAVPTTNDSSAAIGPKAVAAATVVVVFFGIVLFGIPFADMFRVQKDSAYFAVIVVALVSSIFTGFRVWSFLPPQTPRWWFKPLSVMAFVAAVPAIGLAVFFAWNLPEGFDNPAPSEAVLVPICFVGALALPFAGVALWRASTRGRSAQKARLEEPGTPRISRLAVIGACWVPLAIAAILAAYLVLNVSRDGVEQPSSWQLGVLVPLLVLAVGGPFGTTILGWLAVAEISRSRGKVHGLHLAVFDGLVYPLIALSASLVGGITYYASLALTDQPSIGLGFVLVVVGVVIAVNVFVVRAVMRTVRKDAAVAPREGGTTSNQIKLASLALIFALMSTVLGALAAIRTAGVWPAMALAFVFAGVAIFMALPARRLGAGKSALIVAALGMVIWPLVAIVIQRANTAAHTKSIGPEIERVDVSSEKAVVRARGSDAAGMIFLFGAAADRWTPSGLHLEAMFDVSLTSGGFERGVRWTIKPRHGIHMRYRLDGPPGPMLGKIVFHPGTPAPATDGSYLVGEFHPDEGEPLPIAIRLEKSGEDTSKNSHRVPSR